MNIQKVVLHSVLAITISTTAIAGNNPPLNDSDPNAKVAISPKGDQGTSESTETPPDSSIAISPETKTSNPVTYGSRLRSWLSPLIGTPAAAVVAYKTRGNPWATIGTYLLSIIGADTAEYCGAQVWDPRLRTEKCYDRLNVLFPAKGDLEDYSEGLYFNGSVPENSDEVRSADFHNDPAKATLAKFDFIYDQLGFGEVDENNPPVVFDAGCGNGEWMKYLRDKKVKVVGMTLSKQQAENVAKKGFKLGEEIIVGDYTKNRPEFFHRFDAITALGSTEHLCSSLGRVYSVTAEENCGKILSSTLSSFNKWTKDKGKVFITSIVVNEAHQPVSLDLMHEYFLERLFGGYYYKVGTMHRAAVRGGFRIDTERDFTAHYHWASVLKLRKKDIWTIDWSVDTSQKISQVTSDLIKDPHLFHFWGAYILNSWLHHLGGIQTTPLTQEQVDDAPNRLKYWRFLKQQQPMRSKL